MKVPGFLLWNSKGDLAQLVERQIEDLRVSGSTPLFPTQPLDRRPERSTNPDKGSLPAMF